MLHETSVGGQLSASPSFKVNAANSTDATPATALREGAKASQGADADAAPVRSTRRLQRFSHPLERRRPRHSPPEASQGGVREIALRSWLTGRCSQSVSCNKSKEKALEPVEGLACYARYYSRTDEGTPALRASSCMSSSSCLAASAAFFFSSIFFL